MSFPATSNPAAYERARYYVSQFGSADAALRVVDTPLITTPSTVRSAMS